MELDSILLPPELLTSLEGIRGFEKRTFEQVHASGDQVVSVRFNPLKSRIPDLGSPGIPAEPPWFGKPDKVPWSSCGAYLPNRPSFTLDPFFHAGLYYVQEASGMFLEQALKQTIDLSRSIRILDLCAAPGGKSTLIQSLISEDSLLLSNEVIKSRVATLEENMIKWGGTNVVISSNDSKDFSRLPNYFDAIVIDAPCSGSGLFRRDPGAIGEWSKEHVNLCSRRQQRILADAWPALKQDGILIYCTCSYSKEENEDIVDWMMEQFAVDSLSLLVDPEWKITVSLSDRNQAFGYRFYPDKIRGEGFFISCMKKKQAAKFSHPSSKKKSIDKLNKDEALLLNRYVEPSRSRVYFKHESLLHSLPAGCIEDLPFLQQSLYLRKAGTLIGKLIDGELIPDHELALSSIVSRQLHAMALTKEQAIRYLRKEEINVDTHRKGWTLVQYEKINLGWIKILQNRINNYYPKTWRILKAG